MHPQDRLASDIASYENNGLLEYVPLFFFLFSFFIKTSQQITVADFFFESFSLKGSSQCQTPIKENWSHPWHFLNLHVERAMTDIFLKLYIR